jgi:hypothetical protein
LETQLRFAQQDVATAEAQQRLAGSEAAYRTATVRVNQTTEERANIQNELAGIRLNNPNLLPIIREYNHLGNALKFIEFNPSQMVMKLNADADNKRGKVHAFSSSNLTKTLVDLTLPGIGGIYLWQSFLVDRIPSILNQGYYTVTKVAHEFTVDRGWITKIQGRFRYLPEE